MTYEHHELCAECGGKCCKQMPGAMYPEDVTADITNLVDGLKELFSTGKYVVDWWEGDPRELYDDDLEYVDSGYYIRPRTIDDYGRFGNSLFCPSWGSRCVFLTETGCRLEPQKRPKVCRSLEPLGDPDKCIMHDGASKQDAAREWIPYHEQIHKAAKEAIGQ